MYITNWTKSWSTEFIILIFPLNSLFRTFEHVLIDYGLSQKMLVSKFLRDIEILMRHLIFYISSNSFCYCMCIVKTLPRKTFHSMIFMLELVGIPLCNWMFFWVVTIKKTYPRFPNFLSFYSITFFSMFSMLKSNSHISMLWTFWKCHRSAGYNSCEKT